MRYEPYSDVTIRIGGFQGENLNSLALHAFPAEYQDFGEHYLLRVRIWLAPLYCTESCDTRIQQPELETWQEHCGLKSHFALIA